MKKNIIIFDVDGTLVESSHKISKENAEILNQLKDKYEIAVCGGGKLEKILEQMNGLVKFDHYFSECGCVYDKHIVDGEYDRIENIYKKNIRKHNLYEKINKLVKVCLSYFSKVDYILTGHFIDLRCGIIYISCIGMQATEEERNYFKNLNKDDIFRRELLVLLQQKAIELNIENVVSITYGGTVGIAIYPREYDKVQILETIQHDKYDKYDKIIYFGDKYEENGNDYHIINSPYVIGHKVDNVVDTYNLLKTKYL